MPTDWRDDHQYDHFDDLGISGLAWECLRRNLHYRKDYDLMREGGSAPADWGLRLCDALDASEHSSARGKAILQQVSITLLGHPASA